jgi:FMN phosphatase YigB (HAD superfamily)
MVGDSVKADIEGARQIGMRAVLVRRTGDGLSSPLQTPAWLRRCRDRVPADSALLQPESRRPEQPVAGESGSPG